MGSSGRYSVAVSKDQTIKGKFFCLCKNKPLQISPLHLRTGENGEEGFLLSNAHLLTKMVSGYRSYMKELVKQAVETTDSALLFLSPPTPCP